MLDVHPPHAATHTWRDFFIHIATIVIGLLIAVGLEQTVEYFHHRHQVAEAREALRTEREVNAKSVAMRTRIFKNETTRFQTNLKVLLYIQQHPGVRIDQWPAPMNWHNSNFLFADSAWTTVERGSITELMPQKEVRSTDHLYKLLGIVNTSAASRLIAVRDARTYMAQDFDPAHLSPAELQEEIQLARQVLSFQYRLGSDMRNLASFYPDFAPSPQTEELNDIMHEPHLPEYTRPPGDEAEPVQPGHTPAAKPGESQ